MNLIVYGCKTMLRKAAASVVKGGTTLSYAIEYQLLSSGFIYQLLKILHCFAAFFLPEQDGIQRWRVKIVLKTSIGDVILSFRLKCIDEHPANLGFIDVVEEKILLEDPCKASQLRDSAGETKFESGIPILRRLIGVWLGWEMFDYHGKGP